MPQNRVDLVDEEDEEDEEDEVHVVDPETHPNSVTWRLHR